MVFMMIVIIIIIIILLRDQVMYELFRPLQGYVYHVILILGVTPPPRLYVSISSVLFKNMFTTLT
jgi:hypothetical protein